MSTVFSSFLSPGVKVQESDAGYRSQEFASHVTTYIIGSGTTGDFNAPTKINSLANFTNQFGSSPSENSIKLYFRNRQVNRNENESQGVVYFIRTQIAPQYTVTIESAANGAYTLTINGSAVTYTATGSPLMATVRTNLLTAINNNAGSVVTATAGTEDDEIVIRGDNPAVALTITADTANLSAVSSTPTSPTASDYVYSIEYAFDLDDYWAQGFLIAPEAFSSLSNASDRLAVGNAMRALAQSLDWVALVDPHSTTNTVALLQTDSAQYTTAKGHLAYFAPYLTDLENNSVPPSAAVAAVACKRYSAEGFQEPIGGKRYPVEGVKDVAVRFTTSDQDVLNPIGCNLIRKFLNRGTVIWGMRTRSADSLYTFIHTRVIMNVLNGTLRGAFDEYPFSSIDGKGKLLHRIEETAISVCRRLYENGALYGGTEADAFAVECSFDNNQADDLEAGNVLLTVYAAPVPGLEKLLCAVYRVPIGQVQSAADLGSIYTNN